ncbi:MAG TPA: phage Gp37/Gp68 family protein [Planctomycetota bacterium]
MSDRSKIEWTDATWNPVRGCTKISPGCKHCYAATFAERWRGIPGHPYEHGFDLRLVPDKLIDPILWARSRTVFVNSMSDLFQADIPDGYIESVFGVMHLADWYVYQVLTKRAQRMKTVLTRRRDQGHPPQQHVWLGVSVENKKHGLPRIEHLRETPAAIRFLSVEPLLEDLGELDLDGIDWVIVGGESGPGARPMHADWVASVQQQCVDAGVPFFFKQWGGVQKSRFGRELEGRTWNELPPLPELPVPSSAERKRRREIVEKDLARGR